MTANSPEPLGQPPEATILMKLRNLLIVLVATILSVALFFGLQTQTNTVSLTTIDEESVPLEVALSNGKPTFMEFYANWCNVCQTMAPDIQKLVKQYGNSVNFVMLNVDNSKWLPELLKYRVDGIPHFVFLDKQGETIAQTIGEQPRSIMAANLEALITGSALAESDHPGQVSQFEAPVAPTPGADDPRRHGAQVVN